jgi:glutathione S-transferase
MKLYGHPGSTCTRKVLTVLAEKGVKPDFHVVELGKGEHKMPEHMARQPFGQVPALDDDGFKLYESRAMCRYIDETRPGTKLTPADPKARAIMEQFISIEYSHFSPPAMKIVYQKVFHPMRGLPTDEAAVEEGKKGLDRVLPVLEKQLKDNAYLAGEAFSLADIMYMPYIEYLYAGKTADQIERNERVHAWWKNVSDRPSWKIATGKA